MQLSESFSSEVVVTDEDQQPTSIPMPEDEMLATEVPVTESSSTEMDLETTDQFVEVEPTTEIPESGMIEDTTEVILVLNIQLDDSKSFLISYFFRILDLPLNQ